MNSLSRLSRLSLLPLCVDFPLAPRLRSLLHLSGLTPPMSLPLSASLFLSLLSLSFPLAHTDAQMLAFTVVERQQWVLSDEGKQVAAEGSHEAKVYRAVVEAGAISQADLSVRGVFRRRCRTVG